MTLEEMRKALEGRNERRTYKAAEIRLTAGEGEAPKINGYAAVFNSPSEVLDDGWGFSFVERVMPGAFAKTIKESDIRALMNHDPNFVLGRNRASTLTLSEDGHGLAMENTPPDTQWSRDLQESMKRGDINQMSFGFQVVKERWTEDMGENAKRPLTRDLLEVKLFDVSVVTFPAYPQTAAAVRGLLVAGGIDPDELSNAVKARAGEEPLTAEGRACIRSAIDVLQAWLPSEPAEVHLLTADRRMRELQLIELAI